MADDHRRRPRPPGRGPSARAGPAGWPGRPAARGSRRAVPSARSRRSGDAEPPPGGGARPGPGAGRGRPGRAPACTDSAVGLHGCRAPPVGRGPDGRRARPSTRSALRLGCSRVGGQDDVDDDRVVGLALRLPHHQAIRRARWPASGPTAGCPRTGRGAPPGARRTRPAPGARPRRRRRRPASSIGPGSPGSGRHVEWAGAGPPRPLGPTTADRTVRTTPARRPTSSSTPRRSGVTVTSTVRVPAGRAHGAGRWPRPDQRGGCGSARWPPGSAPAADRPRRPTASRCR